MRIPISDRRLATVKDTTLPMPSAVRPQRQRGKESEQPRQRASIPVGRRKLIAQPPHAVNRDARIDRCDARGDLARETKRIP